MLGSSAACPGVGPTHETLHQPSDDLEKPIRGGPGRLSRRRLDRRRALADQARNVSPEIIHVGRGPFALLSPRAQASRGGVLREGLLLSRGQSVTLTGITFAARLRLLAELGVPTLIVTPDFVRPAGPRGLSARGRGPRRSRRPRALRSVCGSRSNFKSRRRSVPVSKRRSR